MRTFTIPRASSAALALLLLSTPSDARADEPTPPQTMLLADLGLHVIGVGVQRTVAPRVALQADLDWYVPWTVTGDALQIMGAVVRLRPVFYLTEPAPEGLWLSPFVQGGFARSDRGDASVIGPAAAFGLSLGYAWLIVEHLHLSIGGGGQLHGVVLPGGHPSFKGAFPHVDATVGYAW